MYLLCLFDSLVNIRREEQIPPPGLLDDLIQPRLVYRQVVRVPRVYPGFVEIDNGHLDVGAKCQQVREVSEANGMGVIRFGKKVE